MRRRGRVATVPNQVESQPWSAPLREAIRLMTEAGMDIHDQRRELRQETAAYMVIKHNGESYRAAEALNASRPWIHKAWSDWLETQRDIWRKKLSAPVQAELRQ